MPGGAILPIRTPVDGEGDAAVGWLLSHDQQATYASIRDDLVFVRTTGRLFGPTPLSAPGTPAWAQPFAPLTISPDGGGNVSFTHESVMWW